MITYTFMVTAPCPSMPMRDFYQATLIRDTMISVEDINAAVERRVTTPMYQEQLTEILRGELCEAGDSLTLTGRHFGTEIVT